MPLPPKPAHPSHHLSSWSLVSLTRGTSCPPLIPGPSPYWASGSQVGRTQVSTWLTISHLLSSVRSPQRALAALDFSSQTSQSSAHHPSTPSPSFKSNGHLWRYIWISAFLKEECQSGIVRCLHPLPPFLPPLGAGRQALPLHPCHSHLLLPACPILPPRRLDGPRHGIGAVRAGHMLFCQKVGPVLTLLQVDPGLRVRGR